MTTHRVHHGHNIKRLREIQGVKQQTLALALGTGWNQKKVSLLESKSIIDEALLEQVARALGVSIAAIDGFTEASIVQLVTGARLPEPAGPLSQFTSLEKVLELLEENRSLYQRLLQTEREKHRLQEKLRTLSGAATPSRVALSA